MLIQTIDNASQFRDAMRASGRGDQFSYQALGLLFDYFDECEQPTEFDAVAICCEFVEMDEDEVRDQYSLDSDADVDQITEYLNENTTLIGVTDSGSFVFIQF